MRTRPSLRALLAAMVLAAASLPAGTATASAGCEQPPQIDAPTGFSASARPVVLVHGWDGKGATMQPIDAALKQAGLPVRSYVFDYSSHNTDWAARPTVARCLSQYIAAISAGYRNSGGDGKVIVIAHSMGGLATRFAASSQYTSTPIASDLGALITVDTPSLGSPFGDQSLARAMQALPLFGAAHVTSLFHGTFTDGFETPPGTDASICLALHQPPMNTLPAGCAIPPYLPAGIPITQLAGDITLKRTLFGIPLYSTDFAADGPVSVQSAHSYGVSGPGGRAPQGTLAEDQPTLPCAVDLDDLEALLAGAGIGGLGGAVASLPATLSIDNAAVDEQLAGRTGKAYDAMLAGSYLLAPCSHGGMLAWPPSLRVIVSAVKSDLKALTASRVTAVVDTEPIDATFHPRAGLTVVEDGAASSCVPGSDSVGDAYRCFSGNGIYDPCWADNGSTTTPSVVCQRAPWDTTVEQFMVPSGLEGFTENVPIDRTFPWGVQLTDGERCVAVQGAHDNYDGKVVDYTCGSGYMHVLLRTMHWNGAQASFDSAYYSAASDRYSPGPTETVATAFYAIPDTVPPLLRGNCSLPHGSEGGFPLPFAAIGISCAAASPLINPVMHLPGSCLTSASGCSLSGFTCRLGQAGPPAPGYQVDCVQGDEKIEFSLPG